ncbi:AraC family transcriptional regulator [Microterricola pindariensis]|uniref:Xylulose kinase n=1 Tax=Microterricola pindariensis TaxID=478010 RepID=A0ABX5AVQ7_9MICO|nr:AraC family transcriptional regulator [Microterricola pindariensis]PPL17963.1 xylulose kinase [Microterricola pindariensis]
MSLRSVEVFGRHRVVSSRDLDVARQALSEVYLPMDFPSASASTSLDMSLNVVKVGRVTAGYLQFGDAMRVRTAEAANYHVDIPVAGRARMQAGRRYPVYGTRKTAAVFAPGLPVDLDCDNDFAQIALMLPKAGLQAELESLLGHNLRTPLEFSTALDLASAPGGTVLQALELVDSASDQDDGMLQHPLAAHRLEQVLMLSLLLAQPHNYSEHLHATPPLAGTRSVSESVEMMRARPAHAWTAAELASASSTSVRSLQENFRRSLGTSPMRYLRDFRLERVHEELLAAEPGAVTVTEVAARWGFVHHGRFAAAYRQRFAERPSDTMRR